MPDEDTMNRFMNCSDPCEINILTREIKNLTASN